MFSMEKIGAFIAGKRKESGLTQGQFAEKLNVTHQAVSKWERGEAMPEISKITEVAKTLGVSADEILIQMNNETDFPESPHDAQDCLKKPEDKYTEADNKYYSLGVTPSVSDVYELAPHMSSEVLSDAVHKLIRENGCFSVTLFLPFLDKKTATQIAERIYNDKGLNGVLFLGTYMPPKFVDKMILIEYGRGNLDALKLLQFSKNEAVINAVFDAEVTKSGTWNSMINVISSIPQNVLVKQGIKFARMHELSSFACWWNKFGRDTSALIMVGYAKECGYTKDAWQQIARCYNHGTVDIIQKSVLENIEQNGKDSVSPLQNKINQNNHENNFNDNIQNLVNKAMSKANEGFKKAKYSYGKKKSTPDMDYFYDIFKEYSQELTEKISSLEDKFNNFETLIDDLEDKICDLEDRIEDLDDSDE